MYSKDDILDFIRRRFSDTNAHWFDGNCYFFSKILECRFPGGSICYITDVGHFVYKYQGKLFDASGQVEADPSVIYELDYIKDIDPLWYKSIFVGCIN